MIETPGPGLYRNVPFETYLAWDAVSNSSMQPALRSLAHYRDRQPIEETPAMRLGTLTHTGRFEPERISQTYVVMPAFENTIRRADGSPYDKPKATAAYRELVNDFETVNVGKTVVTQQQFDSYVGMIAALAADERATGYLTGGDYEVSVIAHDPVTGLACKGRVDHLHVRKRRIADLKTTLDASRFSDVIADRSYHRQMAFYMDLLSWLPKPIEIHETCLVAVESSSPYCVRSAPLDEEALYEGRKEYRGILKAIAASLKSKVWPGYESPDKWRLPSWKTRTTAPVNLKIGGKVVTLKE